MQALKSFFSGDARDGVNDGGERNIHRLGRYTIFASKGKNLSMRILGVNAMGVKMGKKVIGGTTVVTLHSWQRNIGRDK